MRKSIGNYINRDTQEEYEIFEEDVENIEPSSPKIKGLTIKEYTTQSGDRVGKPSDYLSSFELNKSVIHKKNT